jgi:hypothetical protein
VLTECSVTAVHTTYALQAVKQAGDSSAQERFTPLLQLCEAAEPRWTAALRSEADQIAEMLLGAQELAALSDNEHSDHEDATFAD